VDRLGLIFKEAGKSLQGETCKSIEALIHRGEEQIAKAAIPEVLDAALLGTAQQIEHYEMAGYRCARTYARQLGEDQAAALLQQTLDDEGHADHVLTALAEADIIESARPAQVPRPAGARLRYVPLHSVEHLTGLSNIRVVNDAGDDLGTLDGFLLDQTSRRPYYVVIDAGGWFGGRRYVLPIGEGTFDQLAKLLRVRLDTETIQRYPQFDAQEFEQLTEDESRRYEARLLESFMPEVPAADHRAYERLPQFRQPEWWSGGVQPERERADHTGARPDIVRARGPEDEGSGSPQDDTGRGRE
jgi:hypothetical protein